MTESTEHQEPESINPLRGLELSGTQVSNLSRAVNKIIDGFREFHAIWLASAHQFAEEFNSFSRLVAQIQSQEDEALAMWENEGGALDAYQ